MGRQPNCPIMGTLNNAARPATCHAPGDANRLVYGIDSYGFTCGGKETYRNKTLDFSKSKNLYYLNPLDLLSSSSISYAKKVCVPDCPKIKDVCNTSSMPCMQEGQYR